MIPVDSLCYVQGHGVGKVEAICNNRPNGGFDFTYCVRLHKNPNKLRWFEQMDVNYYNGPDPDAEKPKKTDD